MKLVSQYFRDREYVSVWDTGEPVVKKSGYSPGTRGVVLRTYHSKHRKAYITKADEVTVTDIGYVVDLALDPSRRKTIHRTLSVESVNRYSAKKLAALAEEASSTFEPDVFLLP